MKKALLLFFIAAIHTSAWCADINQNTREFSSKNTPRPLISFNELKAKQVKHTFGWTDPNGKKEKITIYELEIPYSINMRSMAKTYLKNIYGKSFQEKMLWVEPRMVIIHSIAFGTLERSLTDSGFLDNEVWAEISKWGKFPLGAHFIVDRDGHIYCLTPPRNKTSIIDYNSRGNYPVRRQLKEANPWAIGVENVVPFVDGVMDSTETEKKAAFSNLSNSQIRANAKLIRWLTTNNRTISRIFGHHNFNDDNFRNKINSNGKVLPLPFNKNYVTSNRFDVGDKVIQKILKKVNQMGYELSSQP